jgi:hypothetical protein
VDSRKRAGIVTIAIGSIMTAFFLFGLGLAWLVPALIADPGRFIEIVSRFSAGEIVLLCFAAFLFFLGFYTIYRGVSILTGWRVSEAARAIFDDIKRIVRRTGR